MKAFEFTAGFSLAIAPSVGALGTRALQRRRAGCRGRYATGTAKGEIADLRVPDSLCVSRPARDRLVAA